MRDKKRKQGTEPFKNRVIAGAHSSMNARNLEHTERLLDDLDNVFSASFFSRDRGEEIKKKDGTGLDVVRR